MPSGLIEAACCKLPCATAITDLVVPQDGQAMPVMFFSGQGVNEFSV